MTRPPGEHDPVPLQPAAPLGAGDVALKQALQTCHAADPPPERAHQAAFEARVVADWQAWHAGAAGRPGRSAVARGLAPARSWFGSGSQRGWALAVGAVLAVTLGAMLWLQRPDPAFDELLHPDVLSQMAIGEM